MLLGLGSGVGFMYWHAKGTDPFYGSRANFERPGVEGLEKTVGRRTGVLVQSFRTGRREVAEKAMLDMLAAGDPVAVYADMGFLPYFDFGGAFHFGGHMIVVAGYDPETRLTLVADRDGALHPVALDDLMQARGSKFKPFPPQNAWYTFDFSASHAPQAPDIWQAINDVVTGMLEPPISNMGVKGIRKAAERTRAWPKTMSVEQLRSACLNAFIYIDATGGTGGGSFRYMYGRFLNEAAEITGNPQLAETGAHMKAIGDCWQQAAHIFKSACDAPDPATLLPAAADVVRTIADREETAWGQLRAIVRENGLSVQVPVTSV
jgi:hypothetical protein